LVVTAQDLETTIGLLNTGCNGSLEGLEANKQQTGYKSGPQLRAIRGADIAVQSPNGFQMLKDSLLMMLLVNALNVVYFEAGFRGAFEAFVERPYSDNSVSYRWNHERLLEDESTPEVGIEEARELLGRMVDKMLEVTAFILGAVNGNFRSVNADGRYSRLDRNYRGSFS
jgi:hypothetical protein